MMDGVLIGPIADAVIVFVLLSIGMLGVALVVKEWCRRQIAKVAKRYSSTAYGPEGERLVFDFHADQGVIADGVAWILWRELPYVGRRTVGARGQEGKRGVS